MSGAPPTEAIVKAEHMAVSVLKDLTGTQADVRRLQDVKAKEGPKNMFEVDASVKEDVKEPNFTEIKANIAKLIAIDGTKAPLNDTVLRLQEIIEGRPPTPPALADAHLELIGKVAASMPPLVVALAKETGLDPVVVKARLRTGLIGVRPYVINLLRDESFIRNITRNVANIEYSEDMAKLEIQYDSLKTKVDTTQANLDAQKKVYTNPAGPDGAIEWWGRLNLGQQTGLRTQARELKNAQNTLNNTALDRFARTDLAPADVVNYTADIDTEVQSLCGGTNLATISAGGYDLDARLAVVMAPAAYTREQRVERGAQLRRLMGAARAANRINALYTANVNLESDIKKLQLFDESTAKLAEIQGKQDTQNSDKAELAKLNIQWGKKINEYGVKIKNALDRSFREYYNEVLLVDARKVAEMDAQQKADEKKKSEELQTKRQDDSKELLSRFLRLSLFKYKAGKIDGPDDKFIKNTIKKDLLSSSPEQMARKLLQRVYDQRGSLPASHRAEIETLLKDMGVGIGPPPVTWTDALNSLDSKFLRGVAGEEMPKMLGYAYHRGYYFDKLRMKQNQAEFLKASYNDSFFTEAISKRDDFKKQFEAEFGTGVLTGSDEIRKKIKELLGNDYEGGMKRLMKVMAVVGMGGIGAFAATGGLSAAMAAGGSIDAGLAVSASTLGKLGSAAYGSVEAASQLSGAVLQGAGELGKITNEALLGTSPTTGIIPKIK